MGHDTTSGRRRGRSPGSTTIAASTVAAGAVTAGAVVAMVAGVDRRPRPRRRGWAWSAVLVLGLVLVGGATGCARTTDADAEAEAMSRVNRFGAAIVDDPSRSVPTDLDDDRPDLSGARCEAVLGLFLLATEQVQADRLGAPIERRSSIEERQAQAWALVPDGWRTDVRELLEGATAYAHALIDTVVRPSEPVDLDALEAEMRDNPAMVRVDRDCRR